VEIKLTDADFERCVQFTDLQMLKAQQNNFRIKYNQPAQKIYEHTLQGFLGEQAVANYFNYETVYKGYNKANYDVLGYEVRTVYYSNGILITHPIPEDKPGIYILVSIDKNEMVASLKGWSDIERCNERLENWRADWRYPCFGMPQDQLWPIDTLPVTKELLEHQNGLAS
jgi:hypothetical protein